MIKKTSSFLSILLGSTIGSPEGKLRDVTREAVMNLFVLILHSVLQVYHSFHDEVKLYQQHWWRCDGPCQKRPPYFGMVRRSMNRAPGPYDNWYADHQATCGGNFVKVREPEGYKDKTKKKEKGIYYRTMKQ